MALLILDQLLADHEVATPDATLVLGTEQPFLYFGLYPICQGALEVPCSLLY